LNRLPGPPLTVTDVVERVDALREANPYGTWPNEDFKTGCLALYGREKEAGTELLAIIGAMRKWLDIEEDRIRGCKPEPPKIPAGLPGRRVATEIGRAGSDFPYFDPFRECC
jgi:hypothetical protein